MATVKLDPAKGVQIPNMTTTERNAVSSPETGAIVWNTTTSAVNQYNGSAWKEVLRSDGSAASLTAIPAANITGTLPAISATNLTNIPAANITGTLPAISGANLTGIATPITALNNASVDELVTVGSTTTELDAEAGLTFNGTVLHTNAGNSFCSTHAATRIRIEDDVHCGIEITTPNTQEQYIMFSDPQGQAGEIKYNHSGNYMQFNSAGYIDLLTNGGGEQIRMDSYGRLLIGTTSATNVDNNGLSVRADDYGDFVAKFAHRKSNGDGAGIMIDIENASGSNTLMMRFNVSAGTVGDIRSGQSSTSYNTSSDYRLKENVNYTWDATTKLKQLKPAEFNFKVTPSETVEGFLAHEVSGIVSAAVTGEKDATETLDNVVLKANGVHFADRVTEAEWIQGKTDEEYPSDSTWVASHTQNINQQIDQSKLVPLLVKTIQELEARLTAGGL